MPRTLGRAAQHEQDEVGTILSELHELTPHDPEVWLYGTNLTTWKDLSPKGVKVWWGHVPPDPYTYVVDDDDWRYHDESDYYDRDYYGRYHDEYDDYRSYNLDDAWDPREAGWVQAWLRGDAEANEYRYCDYDDYDYYVDAEEEFEGEEEFFARGGSGESWYTWSYEPRVELPNLQHVRQREKKVAGDRYYRTHRRAA